MALGCVDPVKRVAESKADDPHRRAIVEVFKSWWEHHHDTPMKVSDLHEEVRAVVDPVGKGRQYLAAAIGKLEDTRIAGFRLSRVRTTGRWSADLYSLKRTNHGNGWA